MSWVAVGLGTAGALKGIGNEKKMDRHNKYRSEALRYSPWTGMGDPGAMELPGALEMGLKGAATGMMMGGGAEAASAAGPATGASALGGADMAAQLGTQFGGSVDSLQNALGGYLGQNKYTLLAGR